MRTFTVEQESGDIKTIVHFMESEYGDRIVSAVIGRTADGKYRALYEIEEGEDNGISGN